MIIRVHNLCQLHILRLSNNLTHLCRIDLLLRYDFDCRFGLCKHNE